METSLRYDVLWSLMWYMIMLQGKMFKLMDAKGTFLSDQLKEAIKDDKAEKEKEKLKGGRGGDRGGRGGGRCVFFHYCLARYMPPWIQDGSRHRA